VHRRRDLASFGLSTCRQEDKGISQHGDYDYSTKALRLQ
jgi:hypothetical protein